MIARLIVSVSLFVFVFISVYGVQIPKGDNEWPKIEEEFIKFLAKLIRPAATIPPRSFFLSLTLPTVQVSGFLFPSHSLIRITGFCFSIVVNLPNSHTSVLFPPVQECAPLMPALFEGVDVIELRVDLLKQRDVEFVFAQLAWLR